MEIFTCLFSYVYFHIIYTGDVITLFVVWANFQSFDFCSQSFRKKNTKICTMRKFPAIRYILRVQLD